MTTAEAERDFDRLRDWGLLRRTLPFNWKRDRALERITGNTCFIKLGGKVRVIMTARVELDEKRWLHVSVSSPGRLPTWEEMREVKDLFVGKEKVAIQVLPRESEYVNFHPHVLHLWHCLDGDPVPDFREHGVI